MRYYCTYFDRNYLAKAVALLDSLSRHEKRPYRVFVVCLDEITRLLLGKLAIDTVECIPLHVIERDDLALGRARGGRTLVEYYWTLTPTVILRILEMHPEIDVLTYLDGDLFFYASPDPIYAELGSGSILIHEHRYSPSLKHLEGNGKYNVGLLCFRHDEAGTGALTWWRDRCNEWCFYRYEDGKMGDQMYLDDWTQRFPGVVVLQNAGAGLAPWNHDQYAYGTDAAGASTVNGFPLVFYHFHALTFSSPSVIVPAKHLHYPLTEEVLRRCYLPYARSLIDAVARLEKVMPGFLFGLEDKSALGGEHTFLARRDMWDGIEAVGMPQRAVFTEGDWRLYGSPQLRASAPPAPPPAAPKVEMLWSPDRRVTNSDELLHELTGRPLTQEIRVLCIVGAHLFQEEKLLFSLLPSLEKVYLFEAIPSVAAHLRQMTADNPRVEVFGYAVSDTNGHVDFHVTDNNGESSSLLPLGKHQEIFPWVHEAGVVRVEAHRLDDIIAWHHLRQPDMLFLDVQGAEYLILSTLSRELRSRLKLIYSEVSTEEVYRGARMLEDVKGFLSPEFVFAGFAPIMEICPTHGNAVFVHRDCATLLTKRARPTAGGGGTVRIKRPASRVSAATHDAARPVPQSTLGVAAVNGLRAPTQREAPPATMPAAAGDELASPESIAAMRSSLEDLAARADYSDVNYERRDYAVTAIVSTYGSAAFIRECLQDLETQTVAGRLEIIVIDAASPENERGVVEEFQRTHTNIRYLRTPERIRIYAAWNLGVHLAAAPYVTSMSTNDRLFNDAYEKMARFLDNNADVALVYGDTHLTDLPHQTVDRFVPSARYGGAFRWPDFSFENLLYSCSVGPHPLWRKRLHDELGYFDDRYTAIGDQDFWLRMGRTMKLAHIDEFTGLQWLTDDSLSGQAVAPREIFEIQVKHQQRFLRERGRDYSPEMISHLANRFAAVIVRLVEAGENGGALAFYDNYRGMFPGVSGFERFDSLIAKMRPV